MSDEQEVHEPIVVGVPSNVLARVGVVDGFINPEDMLIPRLLLGQAVSRAVQSRQVQAGEFYLNLDNESLGGAVEVIPLRYGQHRALFDQGLLACRSYDMMLGVGAPGGVCALCPLKDWGSNNEPPACRVNYDYIMLVRPATVNTQGRYVQADETTPMPMAALYSMTSTATKTARLLNALKFNKFGQTAPWYLGRYLLTAKWEQGGLSAYYTPKIQYIGPTPADLIELAEERTSGISSNAVLQANEAEA